MGKVAFLFAGQGAQYPGMGEAFYRTSPAARRVFEAVEAVRPGTIDLCFHGDAEELNRTVNTQPCLFAADLACALAGVEAGLRADCCAGFSLGEVCAVHFGGLFSLEEAARLVAVRSEAMQRCNDAQPGAMAAVLKLTSDQVEDICARFEDAWAVNYNSPGQTVVACGAGTLSAVAEAVKAAGGRCLPLKVGGSFHTPRMRPARDALRKCLSGMTPAPARLPVYANLDARPYTPETAIERLSEQVCHPVRWQQTIETLWAEGVDTFLEFGPGTTLAGLVRRTVPEARTASVCDPQTLDKCLETLKQEGSDHER